MAREAWQSAWRIDAQRLRNRPPACGACHATAPNAARRSRRGLTIHGLEVERGSLVLPPIRSAPATRARMALMAAAETAYWNPAIVTDKDGKATIALVLPEQSTAWRLLAKGITADTLAGEAAETLTVKKDLFGELKLPASFTDGDQVGSGRLDPQRRRREGQIEVDAQNDHRRPNGRGKEDRRGCTPREFGRWRLPWGRETGAGQRRKRSISR